MYTLSTVGTQRRNYLLMNKRVPESIRQAIELAVDKESLALYLNGLCSPAEGAFDSGLVYGKAQPVKGGDIAAAQAVLEADGYTKGADGMYQKDGTPINVQLSTYAKRSCDQIMVLVNEQLKAAGIGSTINKVEEPDGTYMSTKDFDVASYVSITDKTGEPFTFMRQFILQGAYCDVMGYGTPETTADLEKLQFMPTDSAEFEELSNKIMQDFYDAHVFECLLKYNKNSVLRAGATGLNEMNPLQYYGVDKDTDLAF